MANTVFFAWQTDSPSTDNKTFIWDALCAAIGSAQSGQTAEEAQRPESDTRGLSGAPDIVEAIFAMIRWCSVFVADVTLIAATPSGKRVPNPNVLIELGYAARSIGWDRVVLVPLCYVNTLYNHGSRRRSRRNLDRSIEASSLTACGCGAHGSLNAGITVLSRVRPGLGYRQRG